MYFIFLSHNNVYPIQQWEELGYSGEGIKLRKRMVRRQSSKFLVSKGVLWYLRSGTMKRVVMTKEEIDALLKDSHDNRGHLG